MSILRVRLQGGGISYEAIPVLLEITDDKFNTKKISLSGTCEISVSPGSYLVRAYLPSGETVSAATTATEEHESEVTLTPSTSSHEWLAWPQFLGEVARPPSRSSHKWHILSPLFDGLTGRRGWQRSLEIISGLGALTILIVSLVEAITKSLEAPWIVFIPIPLLALIPLFVLTFFSIQREEELTLADFRRTWLRLWMYEYSQGPRPRWKLVPPSAWLGTEAHDPAIVICGLLLREPSLYLLQVGGPRIPWRLVSLPPTYDPVQVLIRLSQTSTTLNGGLAVTVVSQNRLAETLLHYIAAGSFEAAQLTSEQALAEAESMLRDKRGNPIGAAIGGYYLLRVGALDRLHNWPNNLANWFKWLPDGAVIHAWQLLHEPDEAQNSQARGRLLQAAERGLPVYTEGVRLLIDGLELFAYDAVAHDERDEAVEQALKNIRKYAAAVDWNQQLTTFYGADPEKPSLKPVMGMPPSKEEVDLHFLSTGRRRR